ncbi:MAG: GNAT family N-acetyltransferase [Lachnospiraceae bacterium]|nr:GNAT family N-acetyltransferase [Lachnospiraceae bacterium]
MYIRKATPEDAEELLEIYRPYVEHTAITFEYEVPDIEEFRSRITTFETRYPYLVAMEAGTIIGYAYLHPMVDRRAYDYVAETTIYLKEDRLKSGNGRKLYEALEDAARAMNIFTVYACIGAPVVADEHLTDNSVSFHTHMGYRLVGSFEKCGYKFGTWYNMVWMEKHLMERPANMPPFIPFPEVDFQPYEK